MKTPRTSTGVMDYRKMGYLAYVVCGKRLPLTVLQSNAGWYIGTLDDEAGPCSRESTEYWMSEEAAKQAFINGSWTQKQTP